MNVILRLAWRNLWRRPRRTWLTTGAMVFCNVLLVFMIALQFGMYGLMIENSLKPVTGHLQVQAPGYVDDAKMRQTVPDIESLAERLRRELESVAVAARARAFVLASSETRSFGIALAGVQPEHEPRVSSLPGLVTEGRYLDDPAAAEIVIGATLARNLRVGIGDEITLLGSGLDGSFAATVVTVVGVFDSGMPDLDRSLAHIPLGHFQPVFSMRGAGHAIVVNAPTIDRVPAYVEEVEALLPPDADLVVHDWDRLEPGLRQAIQADISSAFFTYAVLAILVAFSVLNTQLMSVLERTREFGIVMALGVTAGRLGRIVLLETVLMGLLGLVIGALLGVAVTAWFAVHGFVLPGLAEMASAFNLPSRLYPDLNPGSVLLGPSVVFVFSLLAALYPALRLYRLTPVEAMRAA